MADLLALDEIDDIRRSVAPEISDEAVDLVEVWRRASANAEVPPRGGAGSSDWGVPVAQSTAPAVRPDRQSVLIATYPARIARVGVGTEPSFGDQTVSVGDWMLEFNWGEVGQEPDVRAGDRIVIALSQYDEAAAVRERISWQPSTTYAFGARVQPVLSNGWAYRCVAPGTSGLTPPAWPQGPKGLTVIGGAALRWAAVPLPTLEVIDAGSRPTYAVSRIVRCKEVQ